MNFGEERNPAATPTDEHAQTLIIADGSRTIRKVFELTFSDPKYRVVCVEDGDQAIREISAGNPSAVFADVFIYGPDGYEVCAFVRKQPHLSRIPVFLLRGAFEPFDEARAKGVGYTASIIKPFESAEVLDLVEEALSKAARG